ncbi:MAG: hypothetical protein ACKPJD_08930, partial [Planctomycetaceae bacterium]
MSAIAVPCPACKSLLKLPDARLVGKTARCPKCSHKFVIQLPASPTPVPEVPAAVEADELPVLPLAPRAGRAARWVPDHEVSSAPVAAEVISQNPVTVSAATGGVGELPDFSGFGVAVVAESAGGAGGAAGVAQGASALAGVRGRRRSGGMAQWISLAAAGLLAAGITVYAVMANRGAA